MILSLVYVSGNEESKNGMLQPGQPVLWMCSSLLSLDVSMESCVHIGYIFKCIHVLRLKETM